MITECPECEKREKTFIAVRNERTLLLLGGQVTGENLERFWALEKQELAALLAIMDHKIDHRLSNG